MGKKSQNPADAFRKAERKKELKKNKAERAKNRELTLVKKDTGELEDEIESLELAGVAVRGTPEEKAHLKNLKEELARILKKKEEYVKDHPEMRRLVYRPRKQKGEEEVFRLQEEIIVYKKRNYFNKSGLPKHPERSVFYDPVFNPLGVAPPGMHYAERPLLPGEVDSDPDESGDEDDNIKMPPGPPPGAVPEETVDSDEDVPMPTDSAGPVDPGFMPPLPPGPPPLPGQIPLPPPPGFANFPPPPFPPSGFPQGAYPMPPPPPGFSSMPPPPPGFYPRDGQSIGQHPSVRHQSVQGHKPERLSHPSLPPRPIPASAVVSAEPELRDLKKESTAFVPASIRKSKVAATSKLNAAPSYDGPETEQLEKKPDLLDTLKGQFGPPPPKKPSKEQNDYDNFMEGMADLL